MARQSRQSKSILSEGRQPHHHYKLERSSRAVGVPEWLTEKRAAAANYSSCSNGNSCCGSQKRDSEREKTLKENVRSLAIKRHWEPHNTVKATAWSAQISRVELSCRSVRRGSSQFITTSDHHHRHSLANRIERRAHHQQPSSTTICALN